MLSLAIGHAYFTKANHRLWEFWTNSAEIHAIAREESFLGRSPSIQIRVLSPQQDPLTIYHPIGFPPWGVARNPGEWGPKLTGLPRRRLILKLSPNFNSFILTPTD